MALDLATLPDLSLAPPFLGLGLEGLLLRRFVPSKQTYPWRRGLRGPCAHTLPAQMGGWGSRGSYPPPPAYRLARFLWCKRQAFFCGAPGTAASCPTRLLPTQ